jgi:hypothetical protein
MATNRKSALRPAVEAPQSMDAMGQRLAHVRANADSIQSFTTKSREAGQERGATAAFDASRAIGFDFAAAVLWTPISMDERSAKKAEPGDMARELELRELHALAEPASSHTVIYEMRGRLQLVANASKPEVVESARKTTRIIPARKDGANAAEAKRDLVAARDAASKLGDHDMAAVYTRHIDAIDNPGRMFALANQISAATKAYSRFRSYLFLAPIEETFKAVVPADAWGRNYEAAASVAQAAHKEYMTNRDAQHRDVDSLREEVLRAITEKFASKFTYETKAAAANAEPDLDAIGSRAISQIFYFANKAHAAGYLTMDQFVNIRATLSVKGELSRILDENGTETFLAYPDPYEPKVKPAKVAPVTTKAKAKAKVTPPAKSASPVKPAPAKKPQAVKPQAPAAPPVGQRGTPPAAVVGKAKVASGATPAATKNLMSALRGPSA